MQFNTMLLGLGGAHNRPGTSFVPTGLVLHSTDTPNATALDERNYFNNHSGEPSSAHMVVDWHQAVTIIPWQPGKAEVAWHAGPTANSKFLGVECCESDDPDKFAQGYLNFISTARTILDWYEWPVDGEHLFAHAQTSALFHETDHQDPIPYLTKHGKTWDQLVADIVEAAAVTPFPDLPANAGLQMDSTVEEGATGGAVEDIQRLLKAKGFDPGPVDGGFGPRTTAAVVAFQTAKGLAADGIVGPQTWARLRAL